MKKEARNEEMEKVQKTKFVRFGIDDFPIRIYDIPGFEGKDSINIVNNKLIETTKEMNNYN